MGTIAAESKVLSDQMISAAAHSLGGIVDTTVPGAAVLPPVSKLDEFSTTVAVAVAKAAIEAGISNHNKSAVEADITDIKWNPEY
ncbi:malolactic enzyme [Lentilactobacillus kosonis]|uniref:Malolactic enzyme n=1 Tax=Lentilactobacillus kosonis TaxID=2810561 RepID=A0A401FN48_9LACO|nr:malolactic enzyme [Lentilactobacillus kosonis]